MVMLSNCQCSSFKVKAKVWTFTAKAPIGPKAESKTIKFGLEEYITGWCIVDV